MLSPPGGAWLRTSTRQQHAHVHAHTRVRTYTHTEETSYCSGHSWDECAQEGTGKAEQKGGLSPTLLPRDTQGSGPSAPALPSGTGAVLAPQGPWGRTRSRYGGWAAPGPAHSWVTTHSMTLQRDIPFTTALLPESRVPYVSAPPIPSWAWGPWHPQHAKMAAPELVGPCWGHPAPCWGSDRPFRPAAGTS